MFIIDEVIKCFDVDLFNKGDIFTVTIATVQRAVIVSECSRDLLTGNESCITSSTGYRPCSIKPEDVEAITRIYENV